MWYVVQTMAGQEEMVKLMLEKHLPKDSYEECRILYYVRKKKYQGEWHEERKRLLPGYLFLVTDHPWTVWETLKKVPKFSKLLGNKDEKEVYPISMEEESFLRKITGDNSEVKISYGMIEGDTVRIISGGLVGLEAVIRKIDRHKRVAYIEMSMFGGVKIVQVGLEIIVKK